MKVWNFHAEKMNSMKLKVSHCRLQNNIHVDNKKGLNLVKPRKKAKISLSLRVAQKLRSGHESISQITSNKIPKSM